jgi:cell division protein FtsZ
MMRTGTDNMPVLTQSVSVTGSAAAGHSLGGLNNDFAGSQVPSVWRHGRTAAAKVEALSQNGMDEIEIPAFLRKQAD